MYNKLLISAGGGIVAPSQQAEQAEQATIAIGLGGTGISCLRTLKKEIYNRVKPDDEISEIAKYKHIKFLAVDTDAASLASNGSIDSLDKNTEYFDISCADIEALLEKAHLLQQNPSLKWLKAAKTEKNGEGISILSATAGAGGVRQVGRLLILQSCKAFVQKLTNLVVEAIKDLPSDASINIHIFTGISGGTGAGTFLDVCYILQHVLAQQGLAGKAFTCGYFFMPDVNVANGAPDYVPSNGFASMKELDYCMNFDNNGGEWRQQYDGFEVKTTNPPVKLAHLITATNAQGVVRSNGYEYAMRVAVDYVLEYIIRPFIPEGDKNVSDSILTIGGHIANVRALLTTVDKKHGAAYEYCVLGAANAYLPYKDITTYLTSKIFEGFGNLQKQIPLQNDIAEFVRSCSLSYEELLRSLGNGVNQIPLYAVPAKELYEDVQGLTADIIPNSLGQMRDAAPAIQGQYERNKLALLDTGDNILVDGSKQITSLPVRVKQKLLQISTQADKGPYYAGAILKNANATDLDNIIRGYITQNDNTRNDALGDFSLRKQEMDKALRELQNASVLNKSKRAETYVKSVHSYFRQMTYIEQLNVMGELLTEFKKQLEDMYEGFFGIFTSVMKNLEATFENNRRTLAEPVAEDTSYAIKLMSIQDLQETLDNTAKAMRIDDQIHGFVNNMLNHPEYWQAQDENKIAKAVSDYFLAQLEEHTSKTIDDYLRVKFNTTEPSVLQAKIYENILLDLDSKSQPLFWVDNSSYQISDAKTLAYLSIPQISQEIKAAAQTYVAGHSEVAVRAAWGADRITLFRFLCGVPMFAYKGVSNYKSIYEKMKIVGSHLYEGSIGDERDNRELIDISPISCLSDEELNDKQKKLNRIYEAADKKKIIDICGEGTAKEYHLNFYDKAVIKQKIEEAEKIIAAKDIVKVNEYLEKLEKEGLPVESYRIIKNNGAEGVEEIVIRDHVLGSQLIAGLLEEELLQIEAVEKVKEELRSLSEDILKKGANISAFAKALVTGVIKATGRYDYVYVKTTYGIEEETVLTNIDSKPYGNDIPLYSAFNAFIELSDEIRVEIEEGAKEALNHKSKEELPLDEVLESLDGTKINSLLNSAKGTFPLQLAEIEDFFKHIKMEVGNLAVML